MVFYLKEDKIVTTERGILATFAEAGPYEVIRQFDKDRIMVKVNLDRPRLITLLRINDGELSYE